MPGITLVGVHSAGGVIQGPGAPNFTINGSPVALLNDAVAPHGDHINKKLVEGSAWMTWNGIPVVRQGNAADCGHTAEGLATWNIE